MAEAGLGTYRADRSFAHARADAPRAAAFALVAAGAAEAIAGEWAALARHAAEDNAFFLPGFALPAANHLGGGVTLATARDRDGRLIGIAPVTRTRLGRLAPAFGTWAHDYAPLGLPLLDRERAGVAAATLLAGAGRASLVIPDAILDGPVAAAFSAAARDARRPVTVLGAHRRACLSRSEADDLRGGQPTRRRKEFARQMRRLAETGPVAVDVAAEPAALLAAFDAFLALETAGWKGGRGTALASHAETAAFGGAAIRAMAESGHLRVVTMSVGGKPIAALVCLMAGATAYTWKIAYDEAFARYSPGVQIMLEAPARLFADPAIMRIDSCASSDHPMIDHLWRERLAIGTLVIGPQGGGLFHRAGLAAARGESAARQFAKRMLARRRAAVRSPEP